GRGAARMRGTHRERARCGHRHPGRLGEGLHQRAQQAAQQAGAVESAVSGLAGGSLVTTASDAALGDQAALPARVTVGGSELPVWPDAQKVEPMSARLMAVAVFSDWAAYHPALIDAAFAAARDPGLRDPMFRGACGVKVRRIPEWKAPAATLIHARALMLAHHTLSRRPVFADDSWASIYRAGDYCMPHSHLRSNASIVY